MYLRDDYHWLKVAMLFLPKDTIDRKSVNKFKKFRQNVCVPIIAKLVTNSITIQHKIFIICWPWWRGLFLVAYSNSSNHPPWSLCPSHFFVQQHPEISWDIKYFSVMKYFQVLKYFQSGNIFYFSKLSQALRYLWFQIVEKWLWPFTMRSDHLNGSRRTEWYLWRYHDIY